MKSRLTHIVTTSFAGLMFVGASALWSGAAHSQVMAMATEYDVANTAALPQQDASAEFGEAADIPTRLRRRVVDYPAGEPAGTIIVDTPNAYLYFVLGG